MPESLKFFKGQAIEKEKSRPGTTEILKELRDKKQKVKLNTPSGDIEDDWYIEDFREKDENTDEPAVIRLEKDPDQPRYVLSGDDSINKFLHLNNIERKAA